MNTRRTKKQSYTMREVSQITALKAYVLRYWETEFDELRPKKDRNNNRIYRIEDIKLIFQIKKLLYDDKYTIEGARQRLKAIQKSGQQMDLAFDRLRKEDAVFEIKKSLQEILVLLDNSNHPESIISSVAVSTKPKKKKTSKHAQRRTVPSRSESSSSNGMLFPSDPSTD